MSACPKEFLSFAERLADTARDVVLGYFRKPFDIESKADESPVTVADRGAEAAMRKAIAAAYPDHGVVGEEYGPDKRDAEYVWILDPIDGTKRFVTGNPQFGTLIGLLHRGRPILGVIAMPAMGERWIGAAGHPTLHKDSRGERQARVRACPDLSKAALHTTSPLMFKGADITAFERVRDCIAIPLYGGDCYSYGLTASGFNDLVIEASLGVYDHLPLVAVIEGAGGMITDWGGAPLNLNSDGRVIAAGDRRCHEAARALLSDQADNTE
jgi:inositol-phosphate phosphatase/L-galactose 1-phosphate phosphatase/histidinol-phosphatase